MITRYTDSRGRPCVESRRSEELPPLLPSCLFKPLQSQRWAALGMPAHPPLCTEHSKMEHGVMRNGVAPGAGSQSQGGNHRPGWGGVLAGLGAPLSAISSRPILAPCLGPWPSKITPTRLRWCAHSPIFPLLPANAGLPKHLMLHPVVGMQSWSPLCEHGTFIPLPRDHDYLLLNTFIYWISTKHNPQSKRTQQMFPSPPKAQSLKRGAEKVPATATGKYTMLGWKWWLCSHC